MGTRVERYGRLWRWAKFIQQGNRVSGRIGFQEQGSIEEMWNQQLQDFEDRQLYLGAAVNLTAFHGVQRSGLLRGIREARRLSRSGPAARKDYLTLQLFPDPVSMLERD